VEKEIVEQRSNSPAEMMKMAVDKGMDLEKLEKLLEIQGIWEEKEAKKAFHQAMSKFKAEAPVISKDKMNSQYKSKYTSLNNLVNTTNPVLSKFGLTASWDIEQNGIIRVICKLTHAAGHSEQASMTAEADVSGAKNKIQQIKSTITYLKGVTFESVCGLASSDANMDDDGNSSETEYITENQIQIIREKLEKTGMDKGKFFEYLGIEELEKLPKEKYAQAMVALNARKEKA